jgi:hypothetical protein
MTKNLPRIIVELQSEDWLNHLFNNFDLNHRNTPKYSTEQGLYYHSCKFKSYEFKTYKGKDITIESSRYFKSFGITIGTNSTDIFDNIEEFCTNEIYTQERSFMIKGSREKSYFYIGDKLLSSARIGKMTDDYTRIAISHTTIDKTPKQNIEVDLSINAEFKISKERIISKFNDYSGCSKQELDSINKWKNVELSIRLQKVKARMESWIENLFECWVDEPEKNIRAIYLTDDQKLQIEKFESPFLKLKGKFKMYSDYTAILIKLDNIEPRKH